ncbi:MAG: hypothetical protein M1324_03545 [Patescibacteria group bacterium]|nr:hypothetical protein [Patescibacteria group bacterium]
MEETDQKASQTAVRPQRGKLWLVIVIILVLAGVGIGGYFVFTGKSNKSKSNVPVTNSNSESNGSSNKAASSSSSDVRWEMASDGSYQASSTPPACPSPLVLPLPADISKAVSVLYPGQYRGNDYKPHGGLRFNDGSNDQTVTAPMDATVVDGSRYLVNGEVQYLFDFINSCGIKYRLGHLRTLSSTFAALADKFPVAQEMDSRTTQINQSVKVKAGDTVATAVGLLGEGNAFFDYGVFDLRQANEVSKSAVYQAAHSNDKDLAWHGVCWLDLLSSENTAKVKSLPATSPGSQSDYCTGSTPATTSASPIPSTSSTNSDTSTNSSTGSGSGSGGGSGTGGGNGSGGGR